MSYDMQKAKNELSTNEVFDHFLVLKLTFLVKQSLDLERKN